MSELIYNEYSTEDSLLHYGVKGMRWGIRKDRKPQGFQYGESAKRTVKQFKNRTKTNLERTSANRNRSQLSDADIDRRISRLKKEKELRLLTESEVKPGRTWVKNFIKNNGGKVLSAVAVGAGAYAVKRAFDNQGLRKAGYILPRGVQGPVKRIDWDWAELAKMIKLPKK